MQRRFAAAAHKLQRLHNELGLANTAGAEFHIVFQVASLNFSRNHAVHLAQRFEHPIIDIAPIHERLDQVAIKIVDNRGVRLRSDNPRLDVGVTLPIASVLEQVGFQRRETHYRRPALTEWAQSRIDPKHESIDSLFVEKRNDLA